MRIERPGLAEPGLIQLWFDLWMELDSDGNRFESFERTRPYELSAGASVILDDGSRYGVRFSVAFACFSGKPFDEVGMVLRNEMEKHLSTLEKWDVRYLKDNGKRVLLG